VGRAGAFKDRPLWRRLQTIHHEIKEGRRPNTSSLAKLLSVSSKTVQRDIDYLRDELEAPIDFDREENGYRYSRSDYVLPFLPVDGNDLFSIGVARVLALGGTRRARPEGSRAAGAADAAGRACARDRHGEPALRAPFRPVREEIWQAAAEAMQRGVALSIHYHRPGAPPEDARLVRPYGFVLSGRDWMMLAEDQAAGVVKSFYLSRIRSAALTGERYAIPKSFNANAFFRDTFGLFVGGGKPFRFRVRFSREVSEEIREQQWHPDQKIEMSRGEVTPSCPPARSRRPAFRARLRHGRRCSWRPELIEELAAQASGLRRRTEPENGGRPRKPKGRRRP
jgi:proteasome accessory factor B